MTTHRLIAFSATTGLALLLAAAVPAASKPAHSASKAAAGDAAQEASALNGATITLIQAITTAQQQTGGRAYDAGVHVAHGTARIVVETNGPYGVQTVAVDATSGQVVGSHSGGEPD